jgi:uncharacterized protein (DUF1778 family)
LRPAGVVAIVAALIAGHLVLADRTRFELEQEDWEQFMELLDRPAHVPPGLRKLFSQPSVFE